MMGGGWLACDVCLKRLRKLRKSSWDGPLCLPDALEQIVQSLTNSVKATWVATNFQTDTQGSHSTQKGGTTRGG